MGLTSGSSGLVLNEGYAYVGTWAGRPSASSFSQYAQILITDLSPLPVTFYNYLMSGEWRCFGFFSLNLS